MNIILILQFLNQLIPLLREIADSEESADPTKGQGAQKLERALDRAEILVDSLQQIPWDVIKPYAKAAFATIVKQFKRSGKFQ